MYVVPYATCYSWGVQCATNGWSRDTVIELVKSNRYGALTLRRILAAYDAQVKRG